MRMDVSLVIIAQVFKKIYTFRDRYNMIEKQTDRVIDIQTNKATNR